MAGSDFGCCFDAWCFGSAALGDEWDSFEGSNGSDDVGSSSVGVSVETESQDVGASDDYSGGMKYTLDFYVALGVGAVGILIVAVFLYFFLKRPKNKWKKGS